ncbi:TonB-dependent receptor [Pseudoalteromonas sp. MMG013]|uniref:TonB-dependent receptor n=1 Tax=Pseudoalteromonas sp. MMG013 TaxID=2822687 RepID=UPI001B3907AF|nr:TonB-dependent receptor [Pseudoalteromonas sp. MMG013]MBQ4864622.1 TonB-dependent receptor [Pseudoalteromonas sp. MMG013]
MQPSRFGFGVSSLAISVQLALFGSVAVSANVIAQEERANEQSVERISVYGRHNQLILDSGTATKSNMALMQTPAAVVVVDKALLLDQAALTLQDAVRNVSGLSQAGNNYGVGDNLILRGLGVSYTYDGMYGGADLGNSFNPTRTLSNVESIEVLKGPATGLYGIGAAGGVINLVEKKPLDIEQYEIKATAGAWNTYGVMIDASNVLSEEWAYRFVANHDSTDGFRSLGSERNEVYASLSFEPNDNHRLLLSAAYIDDEVQIDSVGDPVRILNWDSIAGNPGVVTADMLPNDTNADGDDKLGIELTQAQRTELANSISASDGLHPFDLGSGNLISPLSKPNQGEEKRVKLRHDWYFDNSSSFTQQLLYREYDSNFIRQTGAYNYVYWERNGEINADPRAPLLLDDTVYPYSARRQEYRKQIASEKTWQYFADLKLSWSVGSVVGEHLISANYESRDMAYKSWSIYDADGAGEGKNALPYILDIRNPNWPTGAFEDYSPTLRSNYDKKLTAYGISAQEVLYITDELTVRLGAAHTKVEQKYQHKGTDRTPGISDEIDTSDSGFTFNAGANYQFTEQFAAFINVAKGRTAYSVLGSLIDTSTPRYENEENRPDSESESIDLGVRFTALDEDLIGSVVWFDTRRTNLRYNNEQFNDNPDDAEYNIDVPQYFYDDENKSDGVEVDINLAINDVLSMNANATWQDAVEIRSNKASGQRKGIPEKLGSIWLNYDLALAQLNAPLKVSLGASYIGERTINAANFGLPTSTIGSYTRWDAAVAYHTETYSLRLNLENLTDEKYYAKALFLGGLPGNERNVKLTASYTF